MRGLWPPGPGALGTAAALFCEAAAAARAACSARSCRSTATTAPKPRSAPGRCRSARLDSNASRPPRSPDATGLSWMRYWNETTISHPARRRAVRDLHTLVATQADMRRIDPAPTSSTSSFWPRTISRVGATARPDLKRRPTTSRSSFATPGLEPAGDDGTFFQRFEMITGLSLQPGNAVTLNRGPHNGRVRDRPRLPAGIDVERSVGAGPGAAGRLCRLRHLRAVAQLRRLRRPRRVGQSGADLHARAAGERPEKRLRRPDQHDARVDDAQGRGGALPRRQGDAGRR